MDQSERRGAGEEGAARPPSVHAVAALGFTQVAFAGHNRVEDLGGAKVLEGELRAAFSMLADAGVRNARLLTGLAPGADVHAARAWRAAALGPLHAVFPFLDVVPAEGAADLMSEATWLDGAASAAAGRNPHLAQTRCIIGAADLLVVAWTGRPARGAGGTADAVRLALEHGAPVLWIEPGGQRPPRLIAPAHLDEDFGFQELLEHLAEARPPLLQSATPEVLHSALVDLGLDADRLRGLMAVPPSDEDEKRPARAYRVFRRLLGGRITAAHPESLPADLEADPGFVRLTLAYVQTDQRASRLGARHRSHQVILLAIAIFAAAVGSASALWPALKVFMVALELLLALWALMIWRDSERGRRHQRWGEARRLAEDLRLERAAWSLGVSTIPHGVELTSTEAARHERRLAGLPRGHYDPERVAAWGSWAMDQLVAGQAAYHLRQGQMNGRISHRVHQLENATFVLLMATLVAYLLVAIAMALTGRETPEWLAVLVAMTGAIVPAISAAGLALEATLSLGEEAQRSNMLAARLERLAAGLRPDSGLDVLQNTARAAIRLQRAQEDHWAEGAIRRRLVRGG